MILSILSLRLGINFSAYLMQDAKLRSSGLVVGRVSAIGSAFLLLFRDTILLP